MSVIWPPDDFSWGRSWSGQLVASLFVSLNGPELWCSLQSLASNFPMYVSAALGPGMSQWRSNKTLLMPLWTQHRWAEKMLSRKLEAAKALDHSNSNPGSEAKGLEKKGSIQKSPLSHFFMSAGSEFLFHGTHGRMYMTVCQMTVMLPRCKSLYILNALLTPQFTVLLSDHLWIPISCILSRKWVELSAYA